MRKVLQCSGNWQKANVNGRERRDEVKEVSNKNTGSKPRKGTQKKLLKKK